MFRIPDIDFKGACNLNIFKPFYRVDETRTRATGGTGLGLTIVYNVVNEHNGKVWAESSNLGGLAVTIQLPLWKQH